MSTESPFLELPTELRLNIYEYVFSDSIISPRKDKLSIRIPGLLDTCHKLRAESFNTFLKSLEHEATSYEEKAKHYLEIAEQQYTPPDDLDVYHQQLPAMQNLSLQMRVMETAIKWSRLLAQNSECTATAKLIRIRVEYLRSSNRFFELSGEGRAELRSETEHAMQEANVAMLQVVKQKKTYMT